jgi:hypothetical protein
VAPDAPLWSRSVGYRLLRLSITAVLLSAGLATVLAVRHGDVSGLIHAAPRWSDPAALPPEVRPFPAGQGYDGQFFYRMAVEPFSNADQVAGVRFDAPSLRASRLGYPIAVWIATLGTPRLVPWAMVAVNIIALAVAVTATGATLQRLGADPRGALVVLLLPGAVYGLSMNLADPVALACIAVGLWSSVCGRWLAAGLALAAAVVTRESALVAVVVLAVAGLLEHCGHLGTVRSRSATGRSHLGALVAMTLPIAAYLGVQLWVGRRFGATGFTQSGDANFAPPISTLIKEPGLLIPRDGFSTLRVALLAGLVTLFLIGVTQLRRPGASHDDRLRAIGLLAAMGGLVLLAVQPRVPMFHYRNFSRAAGEFTYLVVVALVAQWPQLARRGQIALYGLVSVGIGTVAWAIWAATPLPSTA